MQCSNLIILRCFDHTGQQNSFFHGSKNKWSVSGAICGAEHESGTRKGVSDHSFFISSMLVFLTWRDYTQHFIPTFCDIAYDLENKMFVSKVIYGAEHVSGTRKGVKSQGFEFKYVCVSFLRGPCSAQHFFPLMTLLLGDQFYQFNLYELKHE